MKSAWFFFLAAGVGLGRVFGAGFPGESALPSSSLIWEAHDANSEAVHFVAFRKTFSLPHPAHSAQIRIFADSRYILWINGKYVVRGPARFLPDRPEFDHLDVAEFLRVGSNTLAVLVLGGASNGQMMKHAPGLAVSLELPELGAVTSNQTWLTSDRIRYRPPHITWGNICDSIDYTMEDGDWTKPDYMDAAWIPAIPAPGAGWGPMVARQAALLKETPVALTYREKLPIELRAGQSWAFDCGGLVQAYTVLELEAAAGSEVELEFAGINYKAKQGWQEYMSSDTHAFSGGKVTVKLGKITLLKLLVTERLYPFVALAKFQSSDPGLNRIWASGIRTTQILSEDAYVDTADRERVEWMDNDPPAFAVTRVALRSTADLRSPVATAALERQLLRRIAQTLQPGGWVKAHTASDRFDRHARMDDRACDWIEGARRYLEYTGDLGTIREIWPTIRAELATLLAMRSSTGLVSGREWIAWGNPLEYIECSGTALNAFVYRALVDAAFLGNRIGEHTAASGFSAVAVELRGNIEKFLWDAKSGTYFAGLIPNDTGRPMLLGALVAYDPPTSSYRAVKAHADSALTGEYFRGRPPFAGASVTVDHLGRIAPTLVANLFALEQGLVDKSKEARVRQFVLLNRSTASGLMTYFALFQQMFEADETVLDGEVVETVRQRWTPMANSPWGTTWEDFSKGSKVHVYGTFPAYLLSSYVLGVRTDSDTAGSVLIDPRLGELLKAQGVVLTSGGPVRVQWARRKQYMDFEIEIPNGIPQAKLSLRATTLTVDGQSHPRLPTESRVEIALDPGIHRGTAQLQD